jgi:hypothetical protein
VRLRPPPGRPPTSRLISELAAAELAAERAASQELAARRAAEAQRPVPERRPQGHTTTSYGVAVAVTLDLVIVTLVLAVVRARPGAVAGVALAGLAFFFVGVAITGSRRQWGVRVEAALRRLSVPARWRSNPGHRSS